MWPSRQKIGILICLLLHVEHVFNQLEPLNFMLFAKKVESYGKNSSMVVTMEQLSTDNLVVRVSSGSYMIAYYEVGGKDEHEDFKFKYCDDIKALLKNLNIVPSASVEYNSGYYVEMNVVFWEISYIQVQLNAIRTTKPIGRPVEVNVKVYVRPPSTCVPLLNMMRCTNPRAPMQINVQYTTVIRVSFRRNCNLTHAVLTWSYMDVVGKRTFSVFLDDLTVTVKGYTLRYPNKYELWRNLYMIYGEGIYNNHIYGARCYVRTMKSKVEAVISGGYIRSASYAEPLQLDGSLSRDYSKRPNEKQFEVYNWDCKSHKDPNRKYCRSKISKAAVFTIPPNTLLIGAYYDFTLLVAADENPGETSKAVQTVGIQQYSSLFVSIRCIANCERNKYNPRSKVLLQVECYNCHHLPTKYSWSVDGHETVDTSIMNMFIHTYKKHAEIRVHVRTIDGRYGTQMIILVSSNPPTGGTCIVKPKFGIEARTDFYVCCTNWKDKDMPIRFFYYANRVLINSCMTCDCRSNLPLHLTSIKVLICDFLLTCAHRYVNVTVLPLPNITMDTPEALNKFLTTAPNDVHYLIQQGRETQLLQTIQSIASRLKTPDLATVLLDSYSRFTPETLHGLGKCANLTRTLAERMSPIDDAKQVVLISALTKLNGAFQAIFNNEMQKVIVEEPYVNVTVSCVTVYNIMKTLIKNLLNPPQPIYDKYMNALQSDSLTQSVIDNLMTVIAGYNNEEVKLRSMIWLNSTWQNERLYRFLYLARRHGLQPDNSDVTIAGVSLDLQCIIIEPDRTYKISTSDRMHKVNISPELIQELRSADSDKICLKVTSTIRELNWWYPEEKQPSSVLLSVRIFVEKDDFTKEIELHSSKITFDTVISKYKPAVNLEDARSTRVSSKFSPNRQSSVVDDDVSDDLVADTGKFFKCRKADKLTTMHQVNVYRMSLDEGSMLVVRFRKTTHKLQVLLIFDELPDHLRKEIVKSGCTVPALSANTTMILRNNCNHPNRVYLAVQAHRDMISGNEFDPPVPYGPALFEFVFQVRSCDYWMYSLDEEDQHWNSASCSPVLEYPKRGTMFCSCSVLSTYTSFVYHVPAMSMPNVGYLPVSTNWLLACVYFVVFVLLFIWILLLFMWHNKQPTKTVLCDMTGVEDDPGDIEVHDVLVYLKTGGRVNAQTTASVRLIFQTKRRTEVMFTLMQDPERPELKRNSTYILWLRTRDIRLPTRVAVAHNNCGRYPSWFLRRIEVTDVQAQLTQVFIVQRWVRDKYLVLSSSMMLRAGDSYEVERWRSRFVAEFERQWINWGMLQPLMGNWRDSAVHNNLTRAQRSCIFINKMMVTYCVCACYMGPTTPETAYADRQVLIDYHDIVTMFVISCALTNFLQFVLEKVFLGNWKLRKYTK